MHVCNRGKKHDEEDLMEADYDVAILGAGPAGLTAAIYAGRACMKTLVVEKQFPGGQVALTDFVENYPGFPEGINGWELTSQMHTQALKFGAELRTEEVLALEEREEDRVKIIKTSQGVISAYTVIVASGARYRNLGIPGEDRFYGRGVSHCATCDGALYKGKVVTCIGGGDTAVQETIFLTRFCKELHLIHRRDRFRAVKSLQNQLMANREKIVIHYDTVPCEIQGETKVERIVLASTKTGEETILPVSGVFIFIGLDPMTDYLKGFLELDENGYIRTDDQMRTQKEGVFACGDVRKKDWRQIITACGEGAAAANYAQHYVEELKGTAYEPIH
jgi:thioredoxin reductase (NADPH)